METLKELLYSPQGIIATATVALWILNWIFKKKPELWQTMKGYIIHFAKAAEKAIPDDTENKSLKKLDFCLKGVIEAYKNVYGFEPSEDEINNLKGGISIVHAELEAAGNLDKPKADPVVIGIPK